VHTETDSLYIHAAHEEAFLKNVAQMTDARADYPIAVGSKLGNVKREHASVGPAYFLGKKNYYHKDEDGTECMRIEGIKAWSMDDNGNRIDHVNKEFNEQIYAGEVILTTCNVLRKYIRWRGNIDNLQRVTKIYTLER
jgi:hypothetical protein